MTDPVLADALLLRIELYRRSLEAGEYGSGQVVLECVIDDLTQLLKLSTS